MNRVEAENALVPETQYLYCHNQCWFVDTTDPVAGDDRVARITTVDVVPGTRLVHKVSKGYVFEFVDEPGTRYECYYGWAFVENTEQGHSSWVQLEELRAQRKAIDSQIEALQLPVLPT